MRWRYEMHIVNPTDPMDPMGYSNHNQNEPDSNGNPVGFTYIHINFWMLTYFYYIYFSLRVAVRVLLVIRHVLLRSGSIPFHDGPACCCVRTAFEKS